MIKKLIQKVKLEIVRRQLEKKYFSKDSKVFFIVSTGRTGTKFFEDFLSQNFNEVYAVHEPRPDFFDIGISKIRKNTSKEEIVSYIKNKRFNSRC